MNITKSQEPTFLRVSQRPKLSCQEGTTLPAIVISRATISENARLSGYICEPDIQGPL